MSTSGADVPARVVLDTSAYSRLRAGDPRILDAVARAETVALPVTVLGELEAGFRLGSRTRENQVALFEFLEEPFVAVLTVTREVARHYGVVFTALRKAGTPIPVNDIWIAAASIDAGGHLLTFDGDFARVAGLDHTVF